MAIFQIPIFSLLLFHLIFIKTLFFSQTSDLGSWNTLNIKYTINNNWSIFTEGQIRSLKFYDNFHYYECKGGFNYKPNKNINLTLGAGSYQTYKEGGNFVIPKNNDELRIWPQVTLLQTIGTFKIEQRYRAELRFTSYGYRNRFRYRLGLNYSALKIKGKALQLGVYNELFFTNNEPYFERNRLQFTCNYKVSSYLSFQLGYLQQFDYKINDETGRDFLTCGVYFEFFKQSKKSK